MKLTKLDLLLNHRTQMHQKKIKTHMNVLDLFSKVFWLRLSQY